MRVSAAVCLYVLCLAAVQTKAAADPCDTTQGPVTTSKLGPAPTTQPEEDSTPPPPASCSSWGCPEGWEPIPGAVCGAAECTNEDLAVCCTQAEPLPGTTPFATTPCSSWTCPDGYSMKDGQHFCSGEVCNNNDLATCCVSIVPVSTSIAESTTTPCSSTLPVTTTKKNWLPMALALVPLIAKLSP